MAVTKDTKILEVNFNGIPEELKKHANWLLWKLGEPNDKGVRPKLPMNEHGYMFRNWNDTSNLYSYKKVKEAYETGKFDGIGFVPKGTDIIVIDLDNLKEGERLPIEKEIAESGVTELSPSGTGLHVYYKGELPSQLKEHAEKLKGRMVLNHISRQGKNIEIFAINTGYITVTGQLIETEFDDITDDNTRMMFEAIESEYIIPSHNVTKRLSEPSQALGSNPLSESMSDSEIVSILLNKAYIKSKDLHVSELYGGNTSAYGDDLSSADQSLLNEISFYTQDPQQIARIWLNSPLGQRQKTQERSDYVERSVTKAVQNRIEKGNVYTPVNNYNINIDSKSNVTQIEATQTIIQQLEEEHPQKQVSTLIRSFFEDMKGSINTPAISTGFDTLDNILDGGLYEGLYFVGAISSLGKTTMVTQIVDHIASNGQDVIFISLEMSANEIISKGISRLTKINADLNNLPQDCMKSAREITRVEWHKDYTDKAKMNIRESIKDYQKIGEHLWIHEGIGNIGVEEIKAITEAHINRTGTPPVIVIDYLQILAPYSERATDKQNTDKAVLELKRLSRDKKIPVIAISSLNRMSYNDPISMASFKESGAIEYSSDVLLGLQFKGVEKNKQWSENPQQKFDVDKAKEKQVREIELKILKNRNGMTGGVVDFEYTPKFNHFVDRGKRIEDYNIQLNVPEISKTKRAKRG
ncbi:DnaB-like helicase C-terminal domain-containing protein [Macrococcoides caseolyticum]|uniref:DnaB-like helicase C-terminal domain-containing protein n=1 Tax=Macrococcoides caseolyticum TaxID=69966 RepID=UPI000C33B78C|nr:DnaB-like helicase C-terminal domain-containing protein [Macrococcus caseolyticus]PKE20726.1 hypothetical protein CW688_10975 [Macrococcus caseolyticus]PKE71373.1 hypothetical protein CW665_10800 [Macrococcus caseolyticus]PKF05326.1 hypothetical protein CW698_10540 [Macrococcus caseolyticus]